jgi:hypothetical protein
MTVRDVLMWAWIDVKDLVRTVFLPDLTYGLPALGRLFIVLPLIVVAAVGLVPLVPFVAVTVALRMRWHVLAAVPHPDVTRWSRPNPTLLVRIGDTIHRGPDPGFLRTCQCRSCRAEVARRRTATYRLANAATGLLVVVAALAALLTLRLVITFGVAVWVLSRHTAGDLWFAIRYW